MLGGSNYQFTGWFPLFLVLSSYSSDSLVATCHTAFYNVHSLSDGLLGYCIFPLWHNFSTNLFPPPVVAELHFKFLPLTMAVMRFVCIQCKNSASSKGYVLKKTCTPGNSSWSSLAKASTMDFPQLFLRSDHRKYCSCLMLSSLIASACSLRGLARFEVSF